MICHHLGVYFASGGLNVSRRATVKGFCNVDHGHEQVLRQLK